MAGDFARQGYFYTCDAYTRSTIANGKTGKESDRPRAPRCVSNLAFIGFESWIRSGESTLRSTCVQLSDTRRNAESLPRVHARVELFNKDDLFACSMLITEWTVFSKLFPSIRVILFRFSNSSNSTMMDSPTKLFHHQQKCVVTSPDDEQSDRISFRQSSCTLLSAR